MISGTGHFQASSCPASSLAGRRGSRPGGGWPRGRRRAGWRSRAENRAPPRTGPTCTWRSASVRASRSCDLPPAARPAQRSTSSSRALLSDRRTDRRQNCSFSNSGGKSLRFSAPTTSTRVGCSCMNWRDLQQAHPQQRIEQDRQHRDHEQRPPIAQLIADFAGENQFDVG